MLHYWHRCTLDESAGRIGGVGHRFHRFQASGAPVNFAFFENLSSEEAEQYKARFLELGQAALPSLIADAEAAGVKADLSIESVPAVFEWMAGLASTVVLEP